VSFWGLIQNIDVSFVAPATSFFRSPEDDVLGSIAHCQTVVAVLDVVVLKEEVRSTSRESITKLGDCGLIDVAVVLDVRTC
jgi:hypothetical protein